MAGSVGKEVCCISLKTLVQNLTPCKSGMREFLHEVMLRSPYRSCTCTHIDILINKTVTSVIHKALALHSSCCGPHYKCHHTQTFKRAAGCCYKRSSGLPGLLKDFRRPPEISGVNWSSNLIYLIKLFHFELATILLPSYCGRVTQSNPELSDPLSLPSQFVLKIPSSPSEAGWQCHLPFQHLHWGTRFQSSHSHIKYLTARPYLNTL